MDAKLNAMIHAKQLDAGKKSNYAHTKISTVELYRQTGLLLS